MKLHRDDPGADRDQVGGDSPVTSAYVHDQLAGTDRSGLDQSISPGISQLVIAPPGPPIGGHGAP